MINKTIPKDFIDVRNAPVDIHEIEMNIRDFYLSLILHDGLSLKAQCLDARAYLNNAINLTKSLILPEENDYIKKYMKAYFWMLDNLGRASKKINKIEDENINLLNAFENDQNTRITDSPFIRIYSNALHNHMDNLVIYPLQKAYVKFRDYPQVNEDGDKIIKDADLFNYILFVELKNSSELMGSVVEDRIQLSTSISKSQASHDQNNPRTYNPQNDNPPAKPKEIKTELPEDEDLEMGQNAEDFFSEDSERLEDQDKLEKKLFEDDDIEIVEEENESN